MGEQSQKNMDPAGNLLNELVMENLSADPKTMLSDISPQRKRGNHNI